MAQLDVVSLEPYVFTYSSGPTEKSPSSSSFSGCTLASSLAVRGGSHEAICRWDFARRIFVLFAKMSPSALLSVIVYVLLEICSSPRKARF